MSAPRDMSKASVEDTPMSVKEMMQNPANWEFAADLIRHGQISEDEADALRETYPAFWAMHMSPPTGKAN